MLKNVAPLGFNPSQHNRKPQKGNPLVSWLATQDAEATSRGGGGSKAQQQQRRPHTTHGNGRSSPSPEDVPTWCRNDLAGQTSLKMITESFYAYQVQPVVHDFLQACHAARPLHVVAFAHAHFTSENSAAGSLSVGRRLTWTQYEEQCVPRPLFRTSCNLCSLTRALCVPVVS
jgi:hypothetical protein